MIMEENIITNFIHFTCLNNRKNIDFVCRDDVYCKNVLSTCNNGKGNSTT